MGDDTSMEEEFLEVENAGAGEKKMEALFAYLTEIRKAEKSKRQKSKILVIVKNAKVAKLLAASYGGTSVKRVTKQDPRVETLRIRPHMSAGIGQIKIVATQWIGYINEKMKEGDLNGSLLAYKSGKIPCLVTTPEALPSLSPQQHTIKIVIVFDFPSTPDKYLYFMSYSTRKVVSLLPVSASTKQICVELVEGVRERGQDVPPFLATMAEGVKVENAKVAASRGTVVGVAKKSDVDGTSTSSSSVEGTNKRPMGEDGDSDDENQEYESGWSMKAWSAMKAGADVPLAVKLKSTLGDFDHSRAVGIQGGKDSSDDEDDKKRRKKNPGRKFGPGGSWNAGSRKGRKARRKNKEGQK